MKKITLLLLFITHFSSAQQFPICGTPDDEPVPQNMVLSENYDAEAKYVLNIYFTFINDNFGVHYSNIGNTESYGENEAMDIIKILNVEFNQYNIFFKYKGFRIVNDTEMTNNEENLPSVSNMYNFYLMNNVGGYSAVAITGNTRIKMTYDAFEREFYDKVIIHEMGHLLNLAHTYQNYNINNTNNPPSGNCEHVTRDISSPHYNADIAGDKVHDTPAAKPFEPVNYLNCEYIFNPNDVDCVGTPYEDVIPANLMSYEFLSTCPFHFTPGQVIRMRSHLQNPSYPHVLLTYNTVESLYEPFEVTYIPSNEIVSITESELGEGYANVCRINTMEHRYQKGFDYLIDPDDKDFVNSTYTTNDLPEISGIGNYKIKIFQVSDAVTHPQILYSRCVVCNDEPYIGGKIISTEFIGSNNFTQQDLNQIQVSNPNLENNLEDNKYHIIKKETESGAVKQTIIYKQ